MSELHPDSDIMSLKEAIAKVRAWLNQPVTASPEMAPEDAIEQVVSALEVFLEDAPEIAPADDAEFGMSLPGRFVRGKGFVRD